MASANYPELQGAPAACRQTRPWGFQPLVVSSPYAEVAAHPVSVDPVVHSDWPQADFELFAGDDVYDKDVVGRLGYETQREVWLLPRVRQETLALQNNTAFYHPAAKADIQALAKAARAQFDQIKELYAAYHGVPDGYVTYRGKPTGGSRPAGTLVFPLSVSDNDVRAAIDPRDHALITQRVLSRAQIRAAWHRGLMQLWCAMIGRAQSLSYRENEKEWKARHPSSGIAGQITAPPQVVAPWGKLTSPPQAPPPTGPGDTGPEEPPGPGPFQLPPRPERPESFWASIPTATKWLLGGSVVLAAAAGGRAIYSRMAI